MQDAQVTKSLQNVIVIYLLICFILFNHKMIMYRVVWEIILEWVKLAEVPN